MRTTYPTPATRDKAVEIAGQTVRPDDYFNRRRLDRLDREYWSGAYVIDVNPDADELTVFLLREEQTVTITVDEMTDYVDDGDIVFTGSRWTTKTGNNEDEK